MILVYISPHGKEKGEPNTNSSRMHRNGHEILYNPKKPYKLSREGSVEEIQPQT